MHSQRVRWERGTISVPLAWFPRLFYATVEERKEWRLIGAGQGINFEAIDEDISVEGLLFSRSHGSRGNGHA